MWTILFLLLCSSSFTSVPIAPSITMKEDLHQADAFDQQGHKYFQILQLQKALQQQLAEQPDLAQQAHLKKLLAQCDEMGRQLLRYAKMKNTSLKALQARVGQRLSTSGSGSTGRSMAPNAMGSAPEHTGPILDQQRESLTPEEVSDQEFILAIETWARTLSNEFEAYQVTYEAVKVSPTSFSQQLTKRITSGLPLNPPLLQEWQALLEALPDSCTGSQLFGALLQNQGKVWQMINNGAQLRDHYKKNKKVYKKLGLTSVEKSLPQPQFFVHALQASSAEEDPHLPENQEKQQVQIEKRIEQMRQKWDNWLNRDLIPTLEQTDTSTEGKLIDLALLEQNQSVYLMAPTYAQPFWNAISTAILSKAKGLGGTPSYDQVVTLAIETLKYKFDIYMNDDFIQAAAESGEHSLPSGLKRWLVNSIEQDDVLYNELATACAAWASTVQDLVGEAEKANHNKTFKVVYNKWVEQLKASFTGPTQLLVQPIVAQLPKDQVLDLDQIQQAWKAGLIAIQEPTFLEQLWTEQFTRNPEQAAIESVLTAFKTNLPQLQGLSQQLLNARATQPKVLDQPLEQYAQTDTVETRWAIEWNDVPILVGAGMQMVSEETGLESIAEQLVRYTTGDWTADTSNGLTNVVLRATAPMFLDLKIPLQLKRQADQVVAVPQALDASVVKFVGGNDGYYEVAVVKVVPNQAPVLTGTHAQQEILVTIVITDPKLSVSLSGSVGVASVSASTSKNPSKTSVDVLFTLEQTYDESINQIEVQFTRVRPVGTNNLMRSMELRQNAARVLSVYKK